MYVTLQTAAGGHCSNPAQIPGPCCHTPRRHLENPKAGMTVRSCWPNRLSYMMHPVLT